MSKYTYQFINYQLVKFKMTHSHTVLHLVDFDLQL